MATCRLPPATRLVMQLQEGLHSLQEACWLMGRGDYRTEKGKVQLV